MLEITGKCCPFFSLGVIENRLDASQNCLDASQNLGPEFEKHICRQNLGLTQLIPSIAFHPQDPTQPLDKTQGLGIGSVSLGGLHSHVFTTQAQASAQPSTLKHKQRSYFHGSSGMGQYGCQLATSLCS